MCCRRASPPPSSTVAGRGRARRTKRPRALTKRPRALPKGRARPRLPLLGHQELVLPRSGIGGPRGWSGACIPGRQEVRAMPEKKTLERARQDKAQGKAPSTQAGEFVREEIDHIREGKHGARSA